MSLQKAIMTLEEFFHRSEFAYSAWEKSIKVHGQSKWGESVHKIRYLPWNLKDLLQILNSNKVTSSNGFVDQFSKENSFRQMYEFTKRHSKFDYNKVILQSGCFCEICENVVYIAKAMVNVYKGMRRNPPDIVEFYTFDSSSKCCMEDNCSACSVPIKMNIEGEDAPSFSVFNVQKSSISTSELYRFG